MEELKKMLSDIQKNGPMLRLVAAALGEQSEDLGKAFFGFNIRRELRNSIKRQAKLERAVTKLAEAVAIHLTSKKK